MGIPLPALGIKPPDPNSTMAQIQGFIRLRDLANAESARNALAQQQFDATAPLRQAQAQWYQQRAKTEQSALDQQAQMNSLIKQYAQGGKFDSDGFMNAANQAGLGAIAPDYAANLQKVEQNKDAILKARLDNAKAAGQGRASAVSVASKFSQTPAGALMAYHTLVESGSPELAQQFQARVNDPDQGGVQGGFGYLTQLNNAYQSAANAAHPNKPERNTFVGADGQPFLGTVQPNGAGVVNDLTGQIVPGARLYEKQPVGTPRAGMVNGQRVFGVLRNDGWYSTSGQPLPGFSPITPERSGGSGSQKFSPQNPAPAQMFQSLDDEKNAKLDELQSWYGQQLQKAQLSTNPEALKAGIDRQLQAKKQQVQDWYETQNRKLGGQPSHFSYLQTPTATQGQPTPTGKPLTADIARQLLVQAGGNKDLARQLARKAGYSF